MEVSLVMFKADGARREFPLTGSRTIVGRASTSDLRIPLSSVSRQHCEFRIEGDDVFLRDLGSSNGTYHNNSRIQEVEVDAGDEVVIGPVVFTLVIDGRPDAIEPVRTIVNQPDIITEGDELTAPVALGDSDSAVSIDDLAIEEITEKETVDLDDPIEALEAMSDDESDKSS